MHTHVNTNTTRTSHHAPNSIALTRHQKGIRGMGRRYPAAGACAMRHRNVVPCSLRNCNVLGSTSSWSVCSRRRSLLSCCVLAKRRKCRCCCCCCCCCLSTNPHPFAGRLRVGRVRLRAVLPHRKNVTLCTGTVPCCAMQRDTTCSTVRHALPPVRFCNNLRRYRGLPPAHETRRCKRDWRRRWVRGTR